MIASSLDAEGELSLGLAVGVEYDTVSYPTGKHFSLAMFGTLFGSITGLLALTAGVGPMIANMIHDHSGAYDAALWLFVPLGAAAAILFLSLGSRSGSQESTQASGVTL